MKKIRQHNTWMRPLLLSLLLAITGRSAWGQDTEETTYTITTNKTEVPVWEEDIYVDGSTTLTIREMYENAKGWGWERYAWYRRWYLDTSSGNESGSIAPVKKEDGTVENGLKVGTANNVSSLFWIKESNSSENEQASNAGRITYTLPESDKLTKGFSDIVICDISINDDGELSGTTLTEPTLSKRYKFIIHPASEIANKIDALGIEEALENYTIETPKGTKHVNLQMALSPGNYYWHEEGELKSTSNGILYYSIDGGTKQENKNEVAYSPLISVPFNNGLQNRTVVSVYGSNDVSAPKLAEFTIIPQDEAGFMFEEDLTNENESYDYNYRKPISHPELFELVGSYDFDQDDAIDADELNKDNNACLKPMDPTITSYAFAYPKDISTVSTKLTPFQNQYGLYRTAMYKGTGTDSISGASTTITNGGKTYDWYLGRVPGYINQNRPVFDRTYINSNRQKHGYFYYIDASLEAGRIVSVPINGTICGGTELVVTAWINNMTTSADITLPSIYTNLIRVDDSGETVLHRFASGYALTSTDNSSLGKWQQLYYRVTINSDEITPGSTFRLEVLNNAPNSNGNDFAIDDVRIFRTIPRAEAHQGNSLCEEEVSAISISMDYEKLLTMLGLHEEDVVDESVRPTEDVWENVEGHENITDKTKYRKVQYWVFSISDEWKTASDLSGKYLVDNEALSGLLTNQDLYIKSEDEGTEIYRLNYDVLDRILDIRVSGAPSEIFADCFKQEKLIYDGSNEVSNSGTAIISTVPNNMHQESSTNDALAAYKDGSVIFQNVVFPDKGAKSDFYIIYVPTEESIGLQNLNDRCSMVTPFKLKKAEDIVTVVEDGTSEVDVNIDDIEGNKTYTLTGHFSARENVEDEPTEVENATFDWFFGSTDEFQDPAQGIVVNNTQMSIQKALEDYHNTTATSDGHNEEILGLLKAKYGENAIIESTGDAALNINSVKLILHAKSIKIETDKDFTNLPLVVTPNPMTNYNEEGSGNGTLYCVEPREVYLGGETHIVPGDPNVPSLADDWGVRLGMEQIEAMIGDDGTSTALRIPIYDIQPADDDTRNFQIIEGNTEIKVVGTNDEEWNQANEGETEDKNIVASISNLTIPTTGAMTWENSYFEMTFNDNAMKFREGFWYKLNIPFKENVKIEGATEETENKVLTGTFNLLLKIVPKYVVWTGSEDKERNWNNDGHWERAEADDLYDKDDSRAEKYPGEQQAYAPMYFTNVIIQNGENGGAYSAYPYLYELVEKNVNSEDEIEGLLNMDVPEDMDNIIGDATENIEYDLMADPRYEKVYGNNKTDGITAYTCVRFYGNRCNDIHFKPETELLHAEYLAYEHASIDYELDPNRWYTLASPLQGVVAGDMYLPTKGNTENIPFARQETPLFEDITFNTDNYSRWNPAVYMRGWDKSGEGTVVTPDSNNGIKYALEGSWSNLYNKVDEPFTPGTGFSIGVDADMTNETNKKVMFRLPKADTEYLHYPKEDGDAGDKTAIERDEKKVGKLIEVGKDGYSAYTQQTTESYQLIGNPFMAHLNMENIFGEDGGTYYILGEEGTKATIYGTGYTISTDNNSDKVAPLQSFITDKSIKFTNDMQTTATEEGKPTLRAATKSLPEIRLTAERDGKRGTTVVAYLPAASENYLQGEDAMLLADKEQNAPQIYTLSANNRMLAINLTETIEDIPVGIYGTDESLVVLHVQTSGEWGDAVLYDKELKKSYPLQGDVTLNVPGNTSGRYFLRAGTPTANETIATGDILIYSLSGNRVMVTATTPLKDIRVYDMGGAVVKHVKAGVCSFELYLANGIYVITAENAEGETETAKVVVR